MSLKLTNLSISFPEEQNDNKKIGDTFVYENHYKEIKENFIKSLNKELYLVEDNEVFGDFTVMDIVDAEDTRTIDFLVNLKEFEKPNRRLYLRVSESKNSVKK